MLKVQLEPELEAFIEKYGGYWGKGHPDYPPSEWLIDARFENTRLGYWEWAYTSAEGN